MKQIYSSEEELECREFLTIRSIGVHVGPPFQHHGLPEKPLYARFGYSRPTINVAEFGSNKPIAELNENIVEGTHRVIAALDKIIAELSEHRARLDAELERIEREPPIDVEGILLEGLPLFAKGD